MANPRRTYVRTSKAWCSATACDSERVEFGLYPLMQGHLSGELAMAWHAQASGPVPRLEVFTGGLAALHSFADLLEVLAANDGRDFTEKEFCSWLDHCGFQDATEYVQPPSPFRRRAG